MIKLRRGLIAGLLAMALFSQSLSAQVERQPEGPKPPSYDELIRRALTEKNASSNAPVAAPIPPPLVPETKPAPMTTPGPGAESAPPTMVPATDATNSSAVPVVPPPAVPVTTTQAASATTSLPVAPSAPASAESPVYSSPPPRLTTAQNKGPVFSELPADMQPGGVPRQSSVPTDPASAGGAVAATSTNAMDALDEKHLLAIGDQLSFRIVEDEEDPQRLIVTDSGELEVPYIGRYPAVGKSCKELARALKVELEKEHYYQATVILAVDLMARSRGKVYLVGPVRMPGPQEIPSDEVLTLSKAILRAGGFTDFADKKNVKVTRKAAGGGDQTFTVNVEVILERGHTESDLPLLSGDLIHIPERLIRF